MTSNEKVIVITGASTGVGRAMTLGFCREGAHVFGISRTLRDLKETAGLCNGSFSYVAGDIAEPSDIERLFSMVEGQFGRIDVLINNAALYPRESFLASDMEEWFSVFKVNVFGMALCCHRVLPGMLSRGFGRIINLGSFAWQQPIPNSSAYSSSKAAVRSLTRAIASEIDRDAYPDVLINEFAPGVYRTRMTPDQGEDPELVFPHAKALVELPKGGPHGQTFLKSELHEDWSGSFLERWKKRIRRIVRV